MISGYGEPSMRIRQGQIKYADNPILVYEGDEFRHGTKDGKVFLDHVAAYPRQTDNIIACYVRLERNDGSVDYKVLSIEEIQKLRKYSKDPDGKAWTDGLPGMVQSKTIKHAFRSYPKVRLGEFSALQTEQIEIEQQQAPLPKIDYGLEEQEVSPEQPQQPQIPDDSFANSGPQQEGGTKSFEEDENF